MIDKKIIFDGIEYTRVKKIQGEKKVYIEYRNEELKKIKFMEVFQGYIQEVIDKTDLKKAIENNYIIG